LKPDSGRILLNGVDMAGRSPPTSCVTALAGPFRWRAFPVAHGARNDAGRGVRRSAPRQRAASAISTRRNPRSREQAMEVLGLAQQARSDSATLAHGDQKLLDIALALVLDPKVLLLDEPNRRHGH